MGIASRRQLNPATVAAEWGSAASWPSRMSDRLPERFLYVAGTSFTGSTLISFLLNLHPKIVGVGEMTGPFRGVKDRRRYPCSCGAPLSECPFWVAVSNEMATRGLRFDPEHWNLRFDPENVLRRRLVTNSLRNNFADAVRDAAVQHSPVVGKQFREIAHRNEAMAASACTVAEAPVFVDTSKSVDRARQLERMSGLEPYVVHLVRDSLGFVASKKSRAYKNPARCRDRQRHALLEPAQRPGRAAVRGAAAGAAAAGALRGPLHRSRA